MLSVSFELLSFFTVFAGFALFSVLRLAELTVVDFCRTVVVLIPSLCPAALLFSGLLTTVVDDLLVVMLPFPFDLFTVVRLLTEAGDFPIVPEFLLLLTVG